MLSNFPRPAHLAESRRHRRRLGVAAGATVALIASVLGTGIAAAGESTSPTTCVVKAGTGAVSVGVAGDSTALAAALADESIPTIYVGGICKGNFTINRTVNVIGGLRANGSLGEKGTAILDGQATDAVISGYNSTVTVSLSRLIIRNGNGFDGGGILNYGSLTLSRSTVSGNTAARYGGGIANFGGSLTLNHSTVIGNTATDGGGGGINNYLGTITLIKSKVSGNSAAEGGGINNATEGTVSLTHSTISGNTATDPRGGGGGGIHNYIGTTTLIKSKVSRNSTASVGGGIKNSFGTMTLIKSKVSRNSAVAGGGIVNFGESGNVTLTDSTVTSNTAAPVSSSLGGPAGGGGILNGARATLTLDGHTKVTRNTATDGGGGGILNNSGFFIPGRDGTLTTTDSWRGTTCGNTPDDFRAVKSTTYAGQTAAPCSPHRKPHPSRHASRMPGPSA